MAFNPDIHHRRSIRLREYDYSSVGAYFVTMCVYGRECLFGGCADGDMRVNDAGRMVVGWWEKLSERFPQVALDEFVIMPNHFHGIVCITDSVGAAPCGRPPLIPAPCGCPPLGDVMGWFKTMTTNAYIHGVNEMGWPSFPGRLWQRNYFERIIRGDREMSAIRDYIHFNPVKWADDDEYQT